MGTTLNCFIMTKLLVAAVVSAANGVKFNYTFGSN